MLTFSSKVRPVERIERIKAQPLADRARKYVEKMPPAISGMVDMTPYLPWHVF